MIMKKRRKSKDAGADETAQSREFYQENL